MFPFRPNQTENNKWQKPIQNGTPQKNKKNKLEIVSIGKVRFNQKKSKKIIWGRFKVSCQHEKRGTLPT